MYTAGKENYLPLNAPASTSDISLLLRSTVVQLESCEKSFLRSRGISFLKEMHESHLNQVLNEALSHLMKIRDSSERQ